LEADPLQLPFILFLLHFLLHEGQTFLQLALLVAFPLEFGLHFIF
jgi:hypothetical protein